MLSIGRYEPMLQSVLCPYQFLIGVIPRQQLHMFSHAWFQDLLKFMACTLNARSLLYLRSVAYKLEHECLFITQTYITFQKFRPHVVCLTNDILTLINFEYLKILVLFMYSNEKFVGGKCEPFLPRGEASWDYKYYKLLIRLFE